MKELTDKINRLQSIVSQNASLVAQAELYTDIIGQVKSNELEIGKQRLVDKIVAIGGTASMDNTLIELANAIRKLSAIKKNIVTNTTSQLTMSKILFSGNNYVKKAESNNSTIVRSLSNNRNIIEITAYKASNVLCYYNEYLTTLNVPNANTFSSTVFQGCYRLIDITIGKAFNASVVF